MYNRSTEVWQALRNELATAIALTGAGNETWRVFWGAQQRFFKLLCVSMKVPAVVRLARAALDAGQCVVIGLQSTGETSALPSPFCFRMLPSSGLGESSRSLHARDGAHEQSP